ncbi:MAG: PCRF domain-containing protein [Patescibacteria group bacterium]
MEQDLFAQLAQARHLADQTDDPQLRSLAGEEIKHLESLLAKKHPLQGRDAVLEIRPGTGGEEAELFASQLWRMYQRFAERQNWPVSMVESNLSPLGGVRLISAIIHGPGAYQKLRFEGGVHRVQRVPKTEKSGRIHTSAATVAVLPEAKEVDVQIQPSELRIDVYHSGGAGGQSVNTTDSAVRVTHLPSGLVVTCQDERSQLKNKTKALAILRSRLWQAKQEKEKQSTGSLRRAMIGSGDRSEKIRTYNFPQSRLTDHRLGRSWHNLEQILDGALETVIEALIEAQEQVALSPDAS